MDLEKIRDAAQRAARAEGVEVVDVEWKVGKQRMLRVIIDRPGSTEGQGGSAITHGDCERVSHQLGTILDVEELVPGLRYILEVSSPGLDRKLRTPEEFERFEGRRARVVLDEPMENSRHWEGRLRGFAGGAVQLEVNGRVLALPLEKIRKANLVVEFRGR
jgi:ribosome maturation factor RimP